MAVELIEETLTRSIIGGFFEVYNTLGFGFLENVYKIALQRELGARGHGVAREVAVPVMYKGEEISRQRLDMIVDGKIVVETKSSYDLHKGARRQLFNYLKATNLEIGLLLHCRSGGEVLPRGQIQHRKQSEKSAESVHQSVDACRSQVTSAARQSLSLTDRYR